MDGIVQAQKRFLIRLFFANRVDDQSPSWFKIFQKIYNISGGQKCAIANQESAIAFSFQNLDRKMCDLDQKILL